MIQKTKIEWCDYSINPVKGICKLGCPYCYAIRSYKRFKWKPEIKLDMAVFDGIEKLKPGSKVFVGSTHDIFGAWISWDWIRQIIKKATDNPQLVFIFLTKNPELYTQFEFPENAWLGYSTIGTLFHKWDSRHDGNIKFVSLEPMQHPMTASLEGYAQRIDFDWLIIGQETGNRKGKHLVSTDELLSTMEFAIKAGMKIFVKDNLQNLFCNYNEEVALRFRPNEFPEAKYASDNLLMGR